MASNNRAEFKRLILKTERDLLTKEQLRALLTVAEATVMMIGRHCEPSRLASSALDSTNLTVRSPEHRPSG